MWSIYFLMTAVSVGVVAVFFDHMPVTLGRGVFVLPAMWIYGAGFFIGTMIVSSWAKPMAYCLPGHHRISVYILYAACLICVSGSLVAMIWLPPEALISRSAFVLAYVSLNIVAYWIGAATASGVGQWLGFVPLVCVFAMTWDAHVTLEGGMSNPFQARLVCLVCWMFSAYLIWRFQQKQTVRDFCNKPWTGMLDSLNARRVRSLARQRQTLAKEAKYSQFAEVVNQWFCLQMTRQRGGVSRHHWDVGYQTVGRCLLGWKGLPILSVLGVLYMGYMSAIGTPFVIVMICFGMSQMSASVAGGCALLKTGGRKQRFEMAVVGSLAAQGLAMALCLVMILLSHGLAPFLPAVPLDGRLFPFHTLEWWLLLLPMAIMPALSGIGLLFQKKPIWFVAGSLGAMFPGIMFLSTNHYLAGLLDPYFGFYALLICISWCILLACAHWHCFKRDLGNH
jgi:hypothetical protein